MHQQLLGHFIFGRTLFVGLILVALAAQGTPRQAQSLTVQQPNAASSDKSKDNKEEDDPRDRLPELPAREVMKYAQLLYFKARSRWYNANKLERELLKRKEFGDLGLEITREEKFADLVIEITRKKLTTRFTCTMLEPHSKRIVGGTTATSLGGEVEPHLAEALVKEFKAARTLEKK